MFHINGERNKFMFNVSGKIIENDKLEQKMKAKCEEKQLETITTGEMNYSHFDDCINAIEENIATIEGYYSINYPEIVGHGKFKKLKVSFKRLVRKCVHFLFRDLYERQTIVNYNVMQALTNIKDCQIYLKKEINKIKKDTK